MEEAMKRIEQLNISRNDSVEVCHVLALLLEH